MASRFALCAWLLAGALFAAPASATSLLPTDEEMLARLSVDWMQAVEHKDARALQAIVADDFVLQAPGDLASQHTPRGEWIANAIKMDWRDFRYERLVARVDGDHATVSARLYFRVKPIPVALDAGVVDTWVKRDGRWRVTARYLGQSEATQRFAFVFGLLTVLVVLGAWFGIAKLLRRRRVSRPA